MNRLEKLNMKIKSYNPANNELLGEVEQTNLGDIKEIVIKGKKAFDIWGFMTIKERIAYIQNCMMLLKTKKKSLQS